MNIILIVSDTLRRDHLGCYGSKSVLTPNLDRLAEEAVVFDQFYSGSFPTLPCRAELFTGRFVWPYLDWGPLPAREITLAEILADAGYTCALVMDNRHHARAPFFMHLDVFDPHEPWDPPRHYVDLYDPGYDGPGIINPITGDANRYSAAELRHIRALYAGEVTMVDRWLGWLLEAVDSLG